MMRSVKAAVSDADVLLAVVDATEPPPQSLSSITAAIGNGAGAGGNLARSGIALDDVVEANENGLDREDVGLNEDMVAAEAAAAAGMSELGGVSRSGYGSEEAKDDDFFLKVLSTAHQPIVLALNKGEMIIYLEFACR
jgi:predicted GTPase